MFNTIPLSRQIDIFVFLVYKFQVLPMKSLYMSDEKNIIGKKTHTISAKLALLEAQGCGKVLDIVLVIKFFSERCHVFNQCMS